jgi:hypothetical protein
MGLLQKLQYLDASTNAIGGAIPTELGAMRNGIILALFENGLTGSIPPELANVEDLDTLDVNTKQ